MRMLFLLCFSDEVILAGVISLIKYEPGTYTKRNNEKNSAIFDFLSITRQKNCQNLVNTRLWQFSKYRSGGIRTRDLRLPKTAL